MIAFFEFCMVESNMSLTLRKTSENLHCKVFDQYRFGSFASVVMTHGSELVDQRLRNYKFTWYFMKGHKISV